MQMLDQRWQRQGQSNGNGVAKAIGHANAWRQRLRLSLVLVTAPFIGVAGLVCAWRRRSLLLMNALLLCGAPLPSCHPILSIDGLTSPWR
jgi:hypothetical protein